MADRRPGEPRGGRSSTWPEQDELLVAQTECTFVFVGQRPGLASGFGHELRPAAPARSGSPRSRGGPRCRRARAGQTGVTLVVSTPVREVRAGRCWRSAGTPPSTATTGPPASSSSDQFTSRCSRSRPSTVLPGCSTARSGVVVEVRPVAIAVSHDSAQDARATAAVGPRRERSPHGRPRQRQARPGRAVQPQVQRRPDEREHRQARRFRCGATVPAGRSSTARRPVPTATSRSTRSPEDELDTAYAQFTWQRRNGPRLRPPGARRWYRWRTRCSPTRSSSGSSRPSPSACPRPALGSSRDPPARRPDRRRHRGWLRHGPRHLAALRRGGRPRLRGRPVGRRRQEGDPGDLRRGRLGDGRTARRHRRRRAQGVLRPGRRPARQAARPALPGGYARPVRHRRDAGRLAAQHGRQRQERLVRHDAGDGPAQAGRPQGLDHDDRLDRRRSSAPRSARSTR